jgi:hypothetical protein
MLLGLTTHVTLSHKLLGFQLRIEGGIVHRDPTPALVGGLIITPICDSAA